MDINLKLRCINYSYQTKMNLNAEYSKIAVRLTNLVKKTIDDKGLVDSGKMRNTARFEYVVKPDGDAKLTLIAQDYFKYVDKRYGIMDSVFASSEYSSIVDQITKIEADYIFYLATKE